MKYSQQDLQDRYCKFTEHATAHCIFTTELVGGISADEAGIRAFVKHHLHLPEEQIEAAVRRIMTEEVGERDTTPETGELTEKLTYGVNVFRRSPAGPWIGDWMVKACIKAAASRLGLFASKRGSKGDIAEMGRVAAIGDSFLAPDRPEQIYLVDSAGVNLPYQGGVFPGQYGAARLFYYNVIMRRYLKVPQIAAVMGSCVAGGAYLPALSDVIFMVEGTSFMGLGGPNLVAGATGQKVDAETLGGAVTNTAVSGVAHYRAKDDAGCLKQIRDYIALLPAPPISPTPSKPPASPITAASYA